MQTSVSWLPLLQWACSSLWSAAPGRAHLLFTAEGDGVGDLTLSIVVGNAVCQAVLCVWCAECQHECQTCSSTSWRPVAIAAEPTFEMTATEEADAPKLIPMTVLILAAWWRPYGFVCVCRRRQGPANFRCAKSCSSSPLPGSRACGCSCRRSSSRVNLPAWPCSHIQP